MARRTPPETLQFATFPLWWIRIAVAVVFFVLIVAAAELGPRTEWWRIGRRRLDDGATGYLMGGPSVRITTAETSVVVSAAESYRVAGAIRRTCGDTAAARAAGREQADR